MGVNWKHYIVRGIKISYDEWEKLPDAKRDKLGDKHYEGNCGVGELVVITDGMNGEYVVIGIKLFESEDGRYETADIPFVELSDEQFNNDRAVLDFINLNDIIHAGRKLPHFIVFTHYS